MTPKRIITSILAAGAAAAAFTWSGEIPAPSRGFMAQAEARVGRPLTPMSYARVARRTTRRAVSGAAAAGAVAAGAYAYSGSGCVQVIDSYGRVATRCQ
ncbi:hypothetical protein [Microvirga aerophila]|uniref:Uncharacterized protein n=1 Tax=Microvirga aerophila TaxID=670291 RepID=A0A512C3C2_9HYPH|nr:hypothetical protein [Microvirga aerophila]GEO18706.1 hypothetical protein MAE02_64020 [Microvirga aerophila]